MNKEKDIKPSNFWYNVLCVSAITYNLFFIAILIIGLFNIPFLQKTLTHYSSTTLQNFYLQFFIIAMLILNSSAGFGIIKLFSFRKTGYFIYLSSTLSLVVIKLVFMSPNWFEMGLLFLYLLLFTILLKKYA